MSSRSGSLDVRLRAASGATVACRRTHALAYNGTVPGLTIRVRPGDRLRVDLVDDLSSATNLHAHGLYVSPGAAATTSSGTSRPARRRVRGAAAWEAVATVRLVGRTPPATCAGLTRQASPDPQLLLDEARGRLQERGLLQGPDVHPRLDRWLQALAHPDDEVDVRWCDGTEELSAAYAAGADSIQAGISALVALGAERADALRTTGTALRL